MFYVFLEIPLEVCKILELISSYHMAFQFKGPYNLAGI